MAWELPEERDGTEAPADLVERRTLVSGADDQQVVAESVTVDETEIGGVPCLVCRPPSPAGTLEYLHGGGYRLGTARGWLTFGSRLAADSATTVVLVDYRLAPEHPFPAALRDATAVYRELACDGPVHVGGDSAGGGLAAATALAALRMGLDAPAGLLLISPWLDLTQTASTYSSRAETDTMFPKQSADDAAALYLQGVHARDPLASPQFADLDGFPPAQIFVGGQETLLDDSLEFAARLARAGAAVELTVAPDQQHVYPYLAPDSDAGRAAHGAIVRFLTRGR